jgi:hypothetical protein
MLRHAEMPKGSRRAPNVYRRVHSRPRHTAQWVGLFFSKIIMWGQPPYVGTAAIGLSSRAKLDSLFSAAARVRNLTRIPARLIL